MKLLNLKDIIIDENYRLHADNINVELINSKDIEEQQGDIIESIELPNQAIVRVLGLQTKWSSGNKYNGLNPWIYCMYDNQYIRTTYERFRIVAELIPYTKSLSRFE